MKWPDDFARIPDELWTQSPIAELAEKYDSVENHGWYDNLDPTVASLVTSVPRGGLHVDYSAGTAILLDRVRNRHPDCEFRTVLVDASPKFLRLALEKYGDDSRVAFRLINFIRSEKRLLRLDEVLSESLIEEGIDVLTSTNAIHLYYAMQDTLASWHACLKPGGVALIQSGNIDNPEAHADTWIIDQTVEQLQPHAHALVKEDQRYERFRAILDQAALMSSYEKLRKKYFLPVRPVRFYKEQLEIAGFQIESVESQVIEANVSNWADFLAAYHEGVLGWAGGVEKVCGKAPSNGDVELRKQLIGEAMQRLFQGNATFHANWTYIRATA